MNTPAGFSVVRIMSIYPFPGRSPDCALGAFPCVELPRIRQAVEKHPWWLLSPSTGHQMAPNTPLLGRFESDLWLLSAQCRLFQRAVVFSALGHIGQTVNARGLAYATCRALHTCGAPSQGTKLWDSVLLTRPPERPSEAFHFHGFCR